MRHSIWHLLGCILPIAAIFLLPLFGVSGRASVFVFIILMFGCHLFMMRGHGESSEDGPGGEHRHGERS